MALFFLLELVVTGKTDSTTEAQAANQQHAAVGKGLESHVVYEHWTFAWCHTQLSATKNVNFWLRLSSEEDTVAIRSHELLSGNSPNGSSVYKP